MKTKRAMNNEKQRKRIKRELTEKLIEQDNVYKYRSALKEKERITIKQYIDVCKQKKNL